jgi:hypothetical protein
MYKALHQRCISIEVIIGEKQYSLWCQPKKNTFFSRTTRVSAGLSSQPTQFGHLSHLDSRDRSRIKETATPKRCVLKYKQDDILDKGRENE